jgi:hypothetical protein
MYDVLYVESVHEIYCDIDINYVNMTLVFCWNVNNYCCQIPDKMIH